MSKEEKKDPGGTENPPQQEGPPAQSPENPPENVPESQPNPEPA